MKLRANIKHNSFENVTIEIGSHSNTYKFTLLSMINRNYEFNIESIRKETVKETENFTGIYMALLSHSS